MLLPVRGRNICFDIVGPESGQVVAFSHSLAGDSGMWAKHLPNVEQPDAFNRVLLGWLVARG